jgi:signal transduction histidine kinase
MSAIQHRINNTLNIVSPNVTRLRKRVNETDQEIQAILDIIDRNVTYTSLIIHRIQEALRGERQVVNINSILHDVARQAEQHWQTEATGPVEVIPELDDTIPQFEGPIGQISELFTNLANNACRAMIGGGKLNIRSKLDNGIIYVRVKDTGPGIAASILPRLFTRPVPTKETGGTSGLGLYLGSLIAQSLGGNIEVEATGQNGTTMLVRVPVPRR